MPDKDKVCVDCRSPFIWTEKEQEFFKANGFENEPKRCSPCRAKRRAQKRSDTAT